MTDPNASWIAQLLRFDRDGDRFLVAQPEGGPGPRLFGGLIAAQALGAAGSTVGSDKRPQSLHLYFVRGGRYGEDVEIHVDRVRDGRSFDTRRITARQRGEVILEMIASFHRPEPGTDRHPDAPPSVAVEDAVRKEHLPEFAARFEIKTMSHDSSAFAVPPFWIRARDEIESDPLIRACLLTFMSDIGPVPIGRPPGTPLRPGAGFFAASLDHSLWFHRPFEPSRWHRYVVTSLNNSDSRGLVVGSLYDATGSLIASAAQESLWRL
jgi:acyl-CoA thioesterase II